MIDQITPYIKPLAIQIAYAVGFLIIGVIISRIIASNISKKIIHNHPSPGTKKMAQVVYNMITVGSFITLLLISISIVGINISLIIGGIGLAIGYAMEEVLGNIFASLMIVTHHRYHVGDTIKIEGNINQLGVIENVSTRITTIRTFDKQRLMIPNLTMIRTPIIPFTKQ
ncbi:MAG: mechanosensitive ion channel [Candidatus Peribacteria bacterium]|nr:MAG: mechanosensitive ion channel [Candidatus Peribacteria bacterium]